MNFHCAAGEQREIFIQCLFHLFTATKKTGNNKTTKTKSEYEGKSEAK